MQRKEASQRPLPSAADGTLSATREIPLDEKAYEADFLRTYGLRLLYQALKDVSGREEIAMDTVCISAPESRLHLEWTDARDARKASS